MSSEEPKPERIFCKPNDAIKYLKEHTKVSQLKYKCPSCGHIRVLKRGYVIGGGFQTYKHHKCWKCADRRTNKPEPGKVRIKCERCNNARWVMQETYDRNSYGKYCPSCMAVMAHKNEGNQAFDQRAIADLPETANPIRDPLKPCETREYFCLHYSKCLDYTLAKRWPGFSCRECTGGELEPMEQRMMPWSTIMEILPDTDIH